MSNYKLRCESWNVQHVKFSVFDREKANCGMLTLQAADAVHFVTEVWRGDIDWNRQVPKAFTDIIDTKASV